MPPVPGLTRTRVFLDTVTWTPIRASRSCSRVRIDNRGTDAVKLRSDDTDATTEWELPAGYTEILSDGVARSRARESLFAQGCILVYAQAVSGTGPVEALLT